MRVSGVSAANMSVVVSLPALQTSRRSLRCRVHISVDDLAMALVVFSYANPFADQLQLEERIFTIDGQLLRIKQVQCQ